ncbi:methionine--tRNA ligase [Fervidibacter sacchari]|uniref:Methionine--tRNA ligase n=1 Tax=Candidatus Fervidibacter sacchari TaxID=1448929 RepID=A0ABT2ERQ5_9BACT|nr:methionine--tRNA ligase [Candidatus Fervidibacter sacchari]MCS3920645.1 methionyl-tRNA synthetase [Candidatus Fervidibacter sacchari]WKU16380.1 methionine--tRNA ligase [Candidatus Fervidibacter sacchari]
MAERIFIGVAWPYANGPLHLGHIAGAYLPADIFARYHRMKGNEVVMVSGSDTHGAPITLQADKEGVSPRELFERYHKLFLQVWQQFGISFDLYTHTDTENHHRISQAIFLRLKERGYLLVQKQLQMYSEASQRFLPDRYVIGTCPHCGYERARGDQCEKCGALLEPTQLLNPKSLLDGTTPVLRETEHFFLNLPAFEERLKAYVAEHENIWRPNVYRFTRNYLEQGLQPRPITRDLDWGIPVPVEGFEGKVLYVWFEAVIGYLSATVEWAQLKRDEGRGTGDEWKAFWYDQATRSYYFIGKDNIPFHTLIWPAELIGAERLDDSDGDVKFVLPYDVPANEFLNLEGDKFSTSRNWAVWAHDVVARYNPDTFRYHLTAIAPETADTEFTWSDFVRRNNDELVGWWGNLVHRVLTFTARNFDGQVPQPSTLTERDQEVLQKAEEMLATVDSLLSTCRFRRALGEAMEFVRALNRYWDEQQPWQTIKSDKQRTATVCYVALRAIDTVKVALAPFLPFTCERLHQMLGYDGKVVGEFEVREIAEKERTHLALLYRPETVSIRWQPSQLPAGQKLRDVAPLFAKLDEKVAEEERAKLGKPTGY